MKGLNKKTIISLLVLGASWSLVYLIPFIQYVWYDPFQELLGATNTQLGLLISIYGTGVVIFTPFGGWVCDRFNTKFLFIGYLVMYAVITVVFTLFPTYPVAVVSWFLYILGGCFMQYPAHLKLVRNLADDENQGKVYGFNETSIGLMNIVFNFIMVFFYDKFLGGIAGLKAAMISVAVECIIMAVVCFFVLEDTAAVKKGGDEKKEKVGFKVLIDVILDIKTWLVALSVLAVYTMLNTLTYFTPYFTDVLGVTVTFSGVLAILRQHGMTLLGAPIGGTMADKFKAPSKVLLIVYAGGIAGFLVLILGGKMSAAILIFLTLFLSLLVYMGRGCYYATATELGIPRARTATTLGIAATVGFSPDLFQFALYGHWLDTAGGNAYTYMFIFQTAMLVIGALAAVGILMITKKEKAKAIAE